MVTTDMLALREAAIAGVGVVQLPLLMVRDQLAAGTLEVVLERGNHSGKSFMRFCLTVAGQLPSV
jgi:DNA-binding transcriptional LysR family regulator